MRARSKADQAARADALASGLIALVESGRLDRWLRTADVADALDEIMAVSGSSVRARTNHGDTLKVFGRVLAKLATSPPDGVKLEWRIYQGSVQYRCSRA